MKIYRWAEYHKWNLVGIILIVSLIILVSCQPKYNDVPFREINSDTTTVESSK